MKMNAIEICVLGDSFGFVESLKARPKYKLHTTYKEKKFSAAL